MCVCGCGGGGGGGAGQRGTSRDRAGPNGAEQGKAEWDEAGRLWGRGDLVARRSNIREGTGHTRSAR